ncbi:DUF4253 domain-containing protein [Micromonospora auratinigra]|uniref:DUF4253 domain-containing protein n=1 Tax=Micromonospora auratinigra TaxID=261654 RepID=UPI0012FD5324|nr:DUF4253 domain-containing protein [Micromonospora auratinigra]
MRSDLDRIQAALDGTLLAGLPIGPGPAGTVLVADIDPHRLHEAWQAAEALVPLTGRRPLLVTDDFDDTLGIRPEPRPGPSDSRLRAFAEAGAACDPWLTYRHHSEDDDVDEGQAGHYARGLAGVDLTDLVSDLALPVPRPELERTVYDRLLADAGRHARVRDAVRFVTRTSYWFQPTGVQLMLLPTGDVRSSAYWVDFYGAPTEHHRWKLGEVLAQWRDRWDARLVASWGTMLQFQVGRPPAAGDEAWTVAGQLKGLAGNLDLSRWELAVALPAGDAWFVHDRP